MTAEPHNSTGATADNRPGLAIVANSLTPYRVNLHRLIAAGIPEFNLHTIITHDHADFRWGCVPPESIHVSHFGRPGDSPLASTFHSPRYEWGKGGRVIQYLREHDIRAVIVNGYRYLSYLRLIGHCHKAGIPLFVRNDSNIRSEGQLPAAKQFFKSIVYAWWMKRISGVMSMGELGDRFFLKYGADRRHIYRLPYWPDFDAFAQVDADRLERFRRKFGLNDRHHYLIFSGRLVPVKRVDLLIDAFVAIAAERPDWDLLIVGDGVLGDELRRRVPETLRPRIVWTGFLDHDEPALALHAADVLVLPSDREPWALVVQEAMAAGLVVVSSDVSGAAYELVEDGKSGRIFPAGDLAELKRALVQVTDSAALPGFKERSCAALNQWKNKLDPVAEIRRALVDYGVL
jgi:glycosyltransferase involved in cell wall biosynthesis